MLEKVVGDAICPRNIGKISGVSFLLEKEMGEILFVLELLVRYMEACF